MMKRGFIRNTILILIVSILVIVISYRMLPNSWVGVLVIPIQLSIFWNIFNSVKLCRIEKIEINNEVATIKLFKKYSIIYPSDCEKGELFCFDQILDSNISKIDSRKSTYYFIGSKGFYILTKRELKCVSSFESLSEKHKDIFKRILENT